MSLVSVVIPAFNQADFLEEAVESVTSQTHPDVEVIVVDDGSSDETPAVCERLAHDAGVRCLSQPNQGVGAARNRGAAEATGKYLCFLDADDFYHPEKLARQHVVLEESPQVDWVFCDIVTVDESGHPIDRQYDVGGSRDCVNGDILESLAVGGFFPPHTVMIRRTAFTAAGGFDPALGGHADLDLWLRLAAAGRRVEFVDAKLAYYRTHEHSMSRDLSLMRETRIAALTKLARGYPARTARAISRLQDAHEELYRGNRWLHDALGRLAAGTASVARTPGRKVCELVEAVANRRGKTDRPAQVALWDVSLEHDFGRAVLLHPPASLVIEIDEAGACTASGSVVMHPDVWEQPQSGPCEFRLTADDRVRWTAIVDPRSRIEDRRWLPFELHIPASPSGCHVITLETAGVGGDSYRWALWRGQVTAIDRHSP